MNIFQVEQLFSGKKITVFLRFYNNKEKKLSPILSGIVGSYRNSLFNHLFDREIPREEGTYYKNRNSWKRR